MLITENIMIPIYIRMNFMISLAKQKRLAIDLRVTYFAHIVELQPFPNEKVCFTAGISY